MTGTVQQAIRAFIAPGMKLTTTVRDKPFAVEEITSRGVVLLLGNGRYPTLLTWTCLEGIIPFLTGRDWVKIGTKFAMDSDAGSLDDYLKGAKVQRASATYVAAMLEKAGVVEIARTRPATVRLVAD